MPGAPRRSARAPIPSSDEVLLAALVQGEATGTAAFIRRFQGPSYAIALSVLGDRAEAEEIVQQAFVRAWGGARGFDPARGSVAGWMATITRNLAIDHLRRRRPVPLEPSVLAAVEHAADRHGYDHDPEEAALLHADADEGHRALAGLPARQRRAVLLAAWHGRTAREIAEVEGIPLGTAKTRIRTGLRRLRATLAQAPTPDAPERPGQ